jgi:hypothetical protein
MSETCLQPCPEGCDLACEQRVTWKPDPRREHPNRHSAGRRFSTRFLPNGKGGGLVQLASLSAGVLGLWKTVARKQPLVSEGSR